MKELQMSVQKCRTLRFTAMIAVSIAASAQLATAQVEPAAGGGATEPAGQMRFYVELKDATLADAMEMVFKAAGNPAHIVDDSARSVNVANSTFPNHDWHSIVQQLTRLYNFKFYKNDAGTWVIEPRQPPPPANGGFGGEGFPGGGSGFSNNSGRRRGGSGSFGAPQGGAFGNPQGGAVPANPFGGGNRPEVRNFANPQTAPAFGGGAAGGADAGGEEKSFRILIVKHVYAGGIAALFKEAGLIPTGPFVSPGYNNNGGNNRNGGGGGGGFGGNNQGGGGFGGGGFGGGGGGFGGGGFGGGGFGGGGFGGGRR